MRYLKLTPYERAVKRWRDRRNHLVCSGMTIEDANRKMGPMPRPGEFKKRNGPRWSNLIGLQFHHETEKRRAMAIEEAKAEARRLG